MPRDFGRMPGPRPGGPRPGGPRPGGPRPVGPHHHGHHGRYSRRGNVIGATIFGGILFIASFFVLWSSQSQINYAKVASGSEIASADTVESGLDGELVSITGILTSNEKVGDPEFLKTGAYIEVNRSVQMYAWDESKSDDRYTYSRIWTAFPDDSATFRDPQGHQNPRKIYNDATYTVSSATLGAYRLNPSQMTFQYDDQFTVTRENAILSGGARIDGDYIYKGSGSLQSPVVGDYRITMEVCPAGEEMTVFGMLQTASVVPYEFDYGKKEGTLYRAFLGTHDDAIEVLKAEYKRNVLIRAFIGLGINWIGLMMMFSIVSMIFRRIPFLGSVGNFVIFLGTLAVSLVLSLATISLSYFAHRPIVLVIFAGAVVGLLIGLTRKDDLTGGSGSDGENPPSEEVPEYTISEE